MTRVLELARHVYATLGHGYSEAVYHRALEVGLRSESIKYDTERIVPINYQGHVVGNSRLDLVIADELIVELKAVTSIRSKEIQQLRNYMKLTGISRGCVINFPLDGKDDIEVHHEPVPSI